VFIENGEEAIFNVPIPSERSESHNLIITAIPTVLIPSQIPNLMISSDNFTQSCLKDSNELEGICIISSESLAQISGQEIVIRASCI
jgi:hypothetical protein